SHTFTPSPPLLARRVPSRLIATLPTPWVCPWSVSRTLPERLSHTFTVLSALPLTMRFPSLPIATLCTSPVCPRRGSSSLPERPSHCLTMLSLPPLTMRVPSPLRATLLAASSMMERRNLGLVQIQVTKVESRRSCGSLDSVDREDLNFLDPTESRHVHST